METHLQTRESLDPPGMDTPEMDTPGFIGYIWEVWPHLEALNYGATEPLLDSSRQLPWISMPRNLTGKDAFWKIVKLIGTLT